MKRFILILALVLPMAVLAQKTPVDKLFEKYANQKGFTTVNISGDAMTAVLVSRTENELDEEIYNAS